MRRFAIVGKGSGGRIGEKEEKDVDLKIITKNKGTTLLKRVIVVSLLSPKMHLRYCGDNLSMHALTYTKT